MAATRAARRAVLDGPGVLGALPCRATAPGGCHAALAVEAANALVRDIEAIPAVRACSAPRTAVESTVHASLARHDGAQVAFDQQTRHGVTQGATFP